MNSRTWLIVALGCALAVLLTNLPFLPGPSILYYPAQIFYSVGFLLGLLGILLVPIGLAWTISDFQKYKEPRLVRAFSILCWALPIITFVSTVWISEHTRNFSRNIAITNATPLVEQVEDFYTENGTYPESVAELATQVPSSYIIGISSYFYNKTETAYTVSFTQNLLFNFNFEVVLYEPNGAHKAEGELSTLYDTGRENWMYYVYD